MKRFKTEELERAFELVSQVEANQWNVSKLPEGDRLLLCQYWVFSARALLEDHLPEPDHEACLWVLHVVKGIARTTEMFVFGLKQEHQDNWALRAKAVADRIRARKHREPAAPKTKAPKKLAKISVPDPPLSLPNLDGMTIVAIGGDHDTGVLDRYQDANFTIDWC